MYMLSNLMNHWFTVYDGPVHEKRCLEAIPVVVHEEHTERYHAIHNVS